MEEAEPEDLMRLCKSLLRHDSTQRPSGADILRALGNDAAETTLVIIPKASALFVGRIEELDQLEEAFIALSSGRPSVVMLRGPAGTGKTALAARFLESVSHRANTLVLSGKSYKQETVPYKGIDSVIDQLSLLVGEPSRFVTEFLVPRDPAALLAVFPVLESVPLFASAPHLTMALTDRVELRRRGFLALRELLKGIGEQSRFAIWLDDLQWSDRDTAELLAEALRCPDPPTMLLLCSYRSEIAPSAANLLEDALAREPITKMTIPLEPLPEEHAALLARRSYRITWPKLSASTIMPE